MSDAQAPQTQDLVDKAVAAGGAYEVLHKRLHEQGWLTRTFGTWLADITAAAMVVFGLSGIVLFLVPRLRRRQNRRRMRAQSAP